jgi:hypothetical protein
MRYPARPVDFLLPMKDPARSTASGTPLHSLQHLCRQLPPHIRWLLAFYFMASLAHFAHNAETIAFYPNMPAWLTPGDVYRVWLAINGFFVAGLLLLGLRHRRAGLALIALYGALGLDGLGHYWLALCSAHTLAANLTIGAEALGGSMLMLASLRVLACDLARRSSRRRQAAP